MRKLEIEIPNDKEIDWEASAQQKQIVFKDRQLTYGDVCNKLFDIPNAYYTDSNGVIHTFSPRNYQPLTKSPNNATSEHQLSCILAKNKLANVARYLNGELSKKDFQKAEKHILWADSENNIHVSNINNAMIAHGYILFMSLELAKKAIEILGKETIQLALEPLY